jgi:hypothetical protein
MENNVCTIQDDIFPVNQMNAWSIQFFAMIGITDTADLFYPVIEIGCGRPNPHHNDNVFIKFMSQHGERDDEQGLAFKAWLQLNNITYNSTSDRNALVDLAALNEALVTNNLDQIHNQYQGFTAKSA